MIPTPQCGVEVKEGAKFCSECGASLTQAAPKATPKDEEKAEPKKEEKAASKKDTTKKTEKKKKKSEAELLEEAKGFVELGDDYYYGRNGVSLHRGKAMEYYRKAAKLGNDDACIKLGNCYYYGYGVTPDSTQAVEWYNKASTNSHSYYYRAKCCMYGKWYVKDEERAILNFRSYNVRNLKFQLPNDSAKVSVILKKVNAYNMNAAKYEYHLFEYDAKSMTLVACFVPKNTDDMNIILRSIWNRRNINFAKDFFKICELCEQAW